MKFRIYNILIFFGALICLLGAWSVRQPFKYHLFPWVLIIGASAGFGFGASRLKNILSKQAETKPEVSQVNFSAKFGWALILLGLALGILAAVSLWPDINHWNNAFVYWIAAIILEIMGGILITRHKNDTKFSRVFNTLEIICFIIILILAIGVRIYNIDQIPAGIFIDEATASLEAINILQGNQASPFATGWYETPNGYFYYMALIFKLFGVNQMTLKIISIIPAILTIPAVYLLARLMFGSFVGLSAMFFMAISRWHMTMSRWGWNEVMPPLFQTLGLYFLLGAFRRQSAILYILSGIIHGLVLYTYLSSRLVVITVFLFIIIFLGQIFFKNRALFLQCTKGILLFFIAWLITVMPLGMTYLTDPFTFINRTGEVSIFNEVRITKSLKPIINNAVDHLKFFHEKGDGNGRHNLPNEPMLDPVTGTLFVLGFAYGIFRLKDKRFFLLVLWLMIALAGGILSSRNESPQAYRTLTAVPAVTIFAAVSAALLFNQLKKLSIFRKKMSKFILMIGFLVFVSIAGVWEIRTYFLCQAINPSVQLSYSFMETKIAREIFDSGKQYEQIYLSPRLASFSTVNFMAYSIKNGNHKPIFLEKDFPLDNFSGDALLLLDSQYFSLIPYIRSYYPDAQIEKVIGPGKEELYLRVRIPQTAIDNALNPVNKSHNGLKAAYYNNINWKGKSIKEEIIPFILTTWNDEYFSATFTGKIKIAKTGSYNFYLMGDDGVRLKIDGNLIGESLIPDRPNEISVQKQLTAGHHDIQIDYFQNGGGSSLEFYWQKPGASFEPVPPEVLLPI
ncbi:hypothetical protein COY15_04810 [Candidatus Roizmanbacteria bacterium CG_4_10_14_0_2_um_filter_39_12]|nr:MAG: hypothetical protein COY15_04810 [Candidatus Roizmanbacteria bacterium CG_4_10_14_0_2_um_filter_39_12]